MPISISSQVLGTLSVTVAETTGTLEVAVLATAPAVLSVELGTPGPAATVTVGSTTTLSAGSSATVTNSGSSSAAVLNFGIPAGPQGSQGQTGATGSAATISVGSTTTGAAGSSAAVTNSGTSSAAVFNFTIPQGIQGPVGPTGPTGVVAATAPLSYNSGTQTVSIDLSAYASTAYVGSNFYPLSSNPAGYITSSALTGYATQSWVTSQGYLTSSALSPYLLSSVASSTYAPIAAAVLTGGSTGQVLTKSSGSNYALSWSTPTVGDKYYTTSTTSLSVGNGNKSLTVGTGLSYTTQQDIIIAYDAAHHMHGVVTSYNSSTGAMVADIKQHTGSGTYSSWTVNVGGISSVAEWGLITGTLSNQTDLQSALDAKLDVTTAASTYQPIGSYITDAPSDGTPYVRKNGAWEQLIIS